MNFERQQSYIGIAAKFKRDQAIVTTSKDLQGQKLSVRFYCNAFADATALSCKRLNEDDLQALPGNLPSNSTIVSYCKRGMLLLLTLQYDAEDIEWIGLWDKLDFEDPAKLACVETMRQIPNTNKVQVLVKGDDRILQAFVAFKKKILYEQRCPAFWEYMSKAGKYVLQWGLEGFGPERDQYARNRTLAFRDFDQYKLTHGYGVMREAIHTFRYIEQALQSPLTACFVELQGQLTPEGLCAKYIAFVQCDDEELIRNVLTVGDTGRLIFEEMKNGIVQPGWKYTVKPPIPRYTYPGNLILQLRRPKGDTQEVNASKAPKADMPSIQVWAFPDVSDSPARRQIKCANDLADANVEADELKRYLLGKDFQEGDNHRLFDKIDSNPDVAKKIEEFLSHLTDVQRGAWEHIRDAKHKVVLIQGPPGTGKTTTIVTIQRICTELQISWLGAAACNAAADVIASAIERLFPEAGIIRYHAYDNEALALKRSQSDPDQGVAAQSTSKDKAKAKQIEEPSSENSNGKAKQIEVSLAKEQVTDKYRQMVEEQEEFEISAAEEQHAWFQFISEFAETDAEWKDTKKQRPNFKSMGLNVRALQNAGILEHQIPHYKPNPAYDWHAEFRENLKQKNFAKDKTADEKKAYKDSVDRLLRDTLLKCPGIVTTLFKSGDNILNSIKDFVIIFVEEGSQAAELEALLSWAWNTETVVCFVIVGDPEQLHATFKSVNIGTQLNNPFYEQCVMSIMERLWRRGFPTYVLTEQHRLCQGLEEVFNQIFYEGQITNAPGTELKNRPKAQKALAWIEKEYQVNDGIPHVCLNVEDGVQLISEKSKSRYNLHNVVATLHAVTSMLADGLWQETDIKIISPYREQNSIYRKALRQLQLFGVTVHTVDSMQGGEGECTIFDLVLARQRIGRYGFVKIGNRLNVALSRSKNMFMLICDTSALEKSAAYERRLLTLSPEEQEEAKETEHHASKYLRKNFNYYQLKGAVVNVQAMLYKDAVGCVDMSPADEFLNAQALKNPTKTCRNCNSPEHLAKECPHPKKFKGTCNKCGEVGHKAKECKIIVCPRCKRRGHSKEECQGPERRVCRSCGVQGHLVADCPKKPGTD